MKQGPKVVVIGAGSYFFGKPVIYNMVHSPILNSGTLALVDTEPAVLETMMKIAERAGTHAGVPLRIIGSTDRREVLEGADFVVLSFSFRNACYRELDTRISRKYGVTMCSGDTIGPGGIFRALRELPEVLRIAQDVRELAPAAWLINFVNPTSVLGIGLMRHAPAVRSFALCDGNHEPYVRLMYLRKLGIIADDSEFTPEVDAKFDLRIAGVNHCTWILECRYDGRDLLPLLLEKTREAARHEYDRAPSPKAKPRLNANYELALMELYGAFPTAASHTKEYVPTVPTRWPKRGPKPKNSQPVKRRSPGFSKPGAATTPPTSSNRCGAVSARNSTSTPRTAGRWRICRTMRFSNCAASSTCRGPGRCRREKCRAASSGSRTRCSIRMN